MQHAPRDAAIVARPGSASPRSTPQRPLRVCIHALRPVRGDVRALRAAITLAQAGYATSIVDVEHDAARPHEETLRSMRLQSVVVADDGQLGGVRIKHIFMPGRLTQFYDPIHFAPWLLFKALRMLWGAAVLLRTPADVYHAGDITALPACYIAARLCQKPLIFEPYELPLVQPWIARRSFLRAAASRLLRSLVPSCAGIIVTSPRYAAEFHRRYGGREPVVIRNIPLYQPPVSSNRLRGDLGLDAETRIALYQGGLNVDRGLDVLVRAARHLEPGTVIVLKAWGEGQAALEDLITQEGVGEQVKIVPPVPYEELQAWTGSADIGLVIYQPRSLSVRLTLPNKLFEYLMAGIPVLASPLDAVAEVIRAYDVGHIVTSLDPPQVARAINEMVADRAGLARMRANALAASQRDLCWEVESRRLLQLYEAVVRGAPARRRRGQCLPHDARLLAPTVNLRSGGRNGSRA